MTSWISLFSVSSILVAVIYGEIVLISEDKQLIEMWKANVTCQKQIQEDYGIFNESYCERDWDTLACWPPTLAGEIAKIPCPNYTNGFNTNEYAYKICTVNGTWYYDVVRNIAWTDYTRCFGASPDLPELIKKHMPYIQLIFNIGYGISLVCLLIATTIMISFRRLRCPRNIIHVNLFVSFILRATISFMKENLLVMKTGFPSDFREVNGKLQFIPDDTHWECKLFFTTFHYILGTNYIWILVEGLYLNMLITVAVFSEKSGIKWFVIFGWASPLLFVVPWVIVRSELDNTLCWNTNNEVPEYFWIMRGPIVLSVAINFVIFLNIIRVLFTKLTAFNSFETKKFRKLGKSTLVLIPLFGVHYIVFLGLPDNVSAKAELVKLYFEMFLNSVQGFIVALLFCFLNGEVQTEIIKTWNRFRLSHDLGRLSVNRDTVMSYVSRTRNSNSNSDERDPPLCEDVELKMINSGDNAVKEYSKEKKNGHVRFQDESVPMLKCNGNNFNCNLKLSNNYKH